MIVDTDVLIWYMRGNEKARAVIGTLHSFSICAVTYAELIPGLRNARELKTLKSFMLQRRVETIPIDPRTTDRAIYLMERFALGHGLRLADALIAATVDIRAESLLTGNTAHYKSIPGLMVQTFLP